MSVLCGRGWVKWGFSWAEGSSGVDAPACDSPLQLAPGGHLGRFCIWTKSAFEKLDKIFGTTTVASQVKKGYKLPRSVMTNGDLTRLINS